MEDTEQQSVSVHVLRHSFKPSEQLGVAIDNFMSNGVARLRLLYASRLVMIEPDYIAMPEVVSAISEAKKSFLRRSRDVIQLGGEFPASRRRVLSSVLANGALRLGFPVMDQQAFSRMLRPTLDIPHTVAKSSRAETHYVYADIGARDWHGVSELPARVTALNDTLADDTQNPLYTVHPSGIDELAVQLRGHHLS